MFFEREIAMDVACLLREHGFAAYFVGGCVRDKVLGFKPADYDIASNAPLAAIERLVTPLAEGPMKGGKSYPVAKFMIRGFQIDITCMKNGSLFDDTMRRDFTMNAMYECPFTGEVVDLLNGRRDMRAGILRGIGDVEAHMIDDRRRMLRAPRFASQRGYVIDQPIWDATRRHAHLIADCDQEWMVKECRGIVEGEHFARAMDFVQSTGLISHIPEVVLQQVSLHLSTVGV